MEQQQRAQQLQRAQDYYDQSVRGSPQQPVNQHSFKPTGKSQKAANIQYQLSSQQAKEQKIVSQAQQQQQPSNNPPSDPNIQYITEEEYLELLKQQQQQQQIQQNNRFVQYHSPSSTAKPKYRPQAQPQPEAVAQYRQRHHFAPPQRIQPVNARIQPVRPLSETSFEKELQRLVESNIPVAEALKSGPRHHHQGIPQGIPNFSFPHDQEYIQQQPTHSSPNVKNGAERRPSKIESPASRYQLVLQPQPAAPSNAPQYYTKPTAQALVSPNFYQSSPPPRQYSSNRQNQNQQPEISLQRFEEIVIQNPNESQFEPSNAMKIVEAPKLQYEKPTQEQLAQTKDTNQKRRPSQISQSFLKQVDTAKQLNAPIKSSIISHTTRAPVSSSTAAPVHSNNKEEPQKNDHIHIPLPEDRPLTQEEFQALVNAGYPVVASKYFYGFLFIIILSDFT